jgi:starch phosphorylase
MTPSSDKIPAALAGLETLAYNLRWTWWPEMRRLFRQLDPYLWQRTRHNPVQLLMEIDAGRLEAAAKDAAYVEAVIRAVEDLGRYVEGQDRWYPATYGPTDTARIAYFSAEFAITESIRVFSGGLGVLAGDHLQSASDLRVPLVAVGLLYRDGYFTQEVDAAGRQQEVYRALQPSYLPLRGEHDEAGRPLRVEVPLDARQVRARVWRAQVGAVPLYLLDTDVAENHPDDRHITDRLYGGDIEHRLKQELVLGIGGLRALRALGHNPEVHHLNEGHAAFVAAERIREVMAADGSDLEAAIAAVRREMVFTTHTPVPAGHDYFPPHLLERYLGQYVREMEVPWGEFLALGRENPKNDQEPFCMTVLALKTAGGRNGVSRLHGDVSRRMWRSLWPSVPEADVPIGHVTNGVHLPTWLGPAFRELYARHMDDPIWRLDASSSWGRLLEVPHDELWAARTEQRTALVNYARVLLASQGARRGANTDGLPAALDEEALTIVFARRFATYKRATLLLRDPDRLARLLNDPSRPVQFVFAGKAHPRDEAGKHFLQQIVQAGEQPEFHGRIMYLANYDVELARLLVHGADVWLNVPRRPFEASGTSGMKSAANGGLNLSVADGWWAEAWTDHNRQPDPIGWTIEGEGATTEEEQDTHDAEALYSLLESEVVPLFFDRDARGVPTRWTARIRSALAQVCPYFNTHRMVQDYVRSYYAPALASRVGAGTDD